MTFELPSFDFLDRVSDLETEFTKKLVKICREEGEDISFALKACGSSFIVLAFDIERGKISEKDLNRL